MQKSSQAEQSNLHKATGTCRQREEGQKSYFHDLAIKPNKEAVDKTVTVTVEEERALARTMRASIPRGVKNKVDYGPADKGQKEKKLKENPARQPLVDDTIEKWSLPKQREMQAKVQTLAREPRESAPTVIQASAPRAATGTRAAHHTGGNPAETSYSPSEMEAVSSSTRAKRRRQEDQDSLIPDYLKPSKEPRQDPSNSSINSMTDGVASMTIKGLRVNVRHEDEDNDNRQEDMGHRRQDDRGRGYRARDDYMLPFHRIVMCDNGRLPLRSSVRAAAVDCFARTAVRIASGTTGAVPLGFELAPASGTYAQLQEISTMPVLKPNLLLRAGVIDPDYRGEVHALFTYMGKEDFGYVEKGERVAQMVSTCFQNSPFHLVSRLPYSGRGRIAGYRRAMEVVAPCPDINFGHPINQNGPDQQAGWAGGCKDCRHSASSEDDDTTSYCMATVKEAGNSANQHNDVAGKETGNGADASV